MSNIGGDPSIINSVQFFFLVNSRWGGFLSRLESGSQNLISFRENRIGRNLCSLQILPASRPTKVFGNCEFHNTHHNLGKAIKRIRALKK